MTITLMTMQINAIIATISNSICIICLIAIIAAICRLNKWHKMSICTGIVTSITSSIVTIWMGMLSTNAIFPFFNDIHPFIDVYCASYLQIALYIIIVNHCTFGMFALIECSYLSKMLPAKYRIHSIAYKIVMSQFTIAMVAAQATRILWLFGRCELFNVSTITYAVNDNKWKQCSAVRSKPRMRRRACGLFFAAMLLFILIAFATKFIEFTKENPHNIIALKEKQIKRFLYVSVISILVNIISVIAFFYGCDWDLQPLYFALKSVSTLFGICMHTQSAADDLSINLFEDQNTLNDTFTIDTVDRESEFLTLTCPMFHVDEKYIEQTEIIYLCLLQMDWDIPRYLIQLIAEYATTQYLKCIECNKWFGRIECDKDYADYNGAKTFFDEDGNARFCLNAFPDNLSFYIHNGDTKQIEIFCVECGVTRRCCMCLYQSLECTKQSTSNLLESGCCNCGENICMHCGICDENNMLFFCQNCYNNERKENDNNTDGDNDFDEDMLVAFFL
eukprot:823192_1